MHLKMDPSKSCTLPRKVIQKEQDSINEMKLCITEPVHNSNQLFYSLPRPTKDKPKVTFHIDNNFF